MKKQEKIFEVKNLVEKIKDAKTVVFSDYRGLSANQTASLRSQIKKMGGELQVVKNRLMARALTDAGLLPEVKKGEDQVLKLEGPTIALLSPESDAVTLKTLVSFGKNLGLLKLKAGFIDGKAFSEEEVTRFASLPSKQDLQAKLVSLLTQPSQKLVYSLNYNLQKLVIILGQVKSKKSN